MHMCGVNTEAEKHNEVQKKMSFRRIIIISVFLLMVIGSFVTAYNLVIDGDKKGGNEVAVYVDPANAISIEIPVGSGTSSIANILKEKGIIKYPFLFKIISRLNGYDGSYKSGTHILSSSLSYKDMMKVLSSNPATARVTLPEGYTVKQIKQKLVDNKLIKSAEFDKVVDNEKFDFKFLNEIPNRKNRLEGYLFPDTYEFDIRSGSKEIINKMLHRFDEIYKPEYYQQAKNLNMTVDQIITLASIIEREARVPEEQKTIAGVFYNRLNGKYGAPRKLQSCATVQYVLGIVKPVLSEKDTQVDSPYNTYKYEGLPPGPICSPGKNAIEAALFPEDTQYIYFVSKGDGSHHFSKTYSEHLAAAKRYGVN